MLGGIERKLRRVGLLASVGMLLATQSRARDAGAPALTEPEPSSSAIEAQAYETAPASDTALSEDSEDLLPEAETEEIVAEAELAEPAPEHKSRYEFLVPPGPSEPAERTQVLTQGNLTILSNTQPPPPAGDLPRPRVEEPQPVPKSTLPEASGPVAHLESSTHRLEPSSKRAEASGRGSGWFLALGGMAFLLLAPIAYLLTRATRRAG